MIAEDEPPRAWTMSITVKQCGFSFGTVDIIHAARLLKDEQFLCSGEQQDSPHGVSGSGEGISLCPAQPHLESTAALWCPMGSAPLLQRHKRGQVPSRNFATLHHQHLRPLGIGPFTSAVHPSHGHGDSRSPNAPSFETPVCN